MYFKAVNNFIIIYTQSIWDKFGRDLGEIWERFGKKTYI